jgi:hypothetical protein
MRVPVGSYPYERWAREVVGLLKKAQINAWVDRRGPRAYQVVVPPGLYHAAGKALAGLGYFTCSAARSPSMAGVKDWRPPPLDEEEIEDTVRSVAEEWLEKMANDSAAMTWSTADDQMEFDLQKRGYENPWVVAEFDFSIAVNGDLLEEGQTRNPPPGYEYVDLGGAIPVVEEIVDLEGLIDVTIREAHKVLGVPVAPKQVESILYREYGETREISVSVSGDATVYAKPKKEKSDE